MALAANVQRQQSFQANPVRHKTFLRRRRISLQSLVCDNVYNLRETCTIHDDLAIAH